MHAGPIYHLTTGPELRAGCTPEVYSPARLPEDGFVHCAGSPAVALSVATDYFRDAGTVYLLVIDPASLTAPLRFEAAAPIAGGGRAHLAQADRFPHVYGPIDRGAIVEAGPLATGPDGFAWPARFEPLEDLLARI